MENAFETLLGLLGGLALFLFGMNLMSERLQKVAGERMRNILRLMTKNPVLGVLAGALATAVLQSSSATTVMTIGFVSAGLMGLPQAISIILGANIGTTMTAQIIAFKISDYIFLFVFLGFILSFAGRRERVKDIGLTIFAFGVLFLGIDTMGAAMKPLASSPVFTQMIAQVADIPVLGVLVGTLMTLVVQSSSATIAVLQNFASQPGPDGVSSILGLQGTIPILLGDNIGTTITALLASIGQSRSAKRVALSHCIFNISGALLFIWFIPAFAQFVQMISPAGPEVDVISRQIANAHTCFNVAMTLIWLPLIPLMVKIVMTVLPDARASAGKEDRGLREPVFLDQKMIAQPAAAMQMIAQEILRFGHASSDMLESLTTALHEGSTSGLEQVIARADDAHALNKRITQYQSAMFSTGVLTEEQATLAAGLMHVQNEVSRVDDLARGVASNLKENRYSPSAQKDLNDSLDTVHEMLACSVTALQNGDTQVVGHVRQMHEKVFNTGIDLRKDHMRRVAQGECAPDLTEQFNDVLLMIGRMGDACSNIAEAVAGSVDFRYLIVVDDDQIAPSDASSGNSPQPASSPLP
ncbi:Na/Pi cotransporter family protein [Adlercreutzia sp. ZJ473]|uniref:Na/Pi cotransporter family protein n=1 Tax=Adlercreutzia sp. ZJ473 TaxID=2722822 RepID=UPI001557CC3D|nr:Na/Pi cotransporter family protein [Adlercreutzia sp. ZJ473]